MEVCEGSVLAAFCSFLAVARLIGVQRLPISPQSNMDDGISEIESAFEMKDRHYMSLSSFYTD